jgi:hypothetical protein
MAKNSAKTAHRRAYVNPTRGFDEAQQRAFIEKTVGQIGEWYVQSRTCDRTDFIQSLRPGDEAVVARAGCLAIITKDRQKRIADLLEARGDISAAHAILVSGEKLRSDKDWPKMKDAALAYFRWTAQLGNASARALVYTDAQIEMMLRIRVDKRYTNDKDRLRAVERAGINPPGRTWFVTMLPIEASRRHIEI